MGRLRRWLSVACYAGCIAALTACGDDESSGTDAGEMMIDGSVRDGGGDASMPDPCAGRALCESEGTSCDGDTLVTCAEDADGCLVATRTGCGTTDQVCEESGDSAACVDPCASIPSAMRCETDGARSCDGDTLAVCAPNTDGCLVLTETNCAEADGGTCDPNGGTSGDMPVCVMPVDPCAGVDETDRCETAGTSCEGDTLVACAPNAMGCLVRTPTDCTTRTDGTCEVTDGTAACTAPDACAGVTQCAAESAICEGPELVACAPDAFGCLVETRTDCTDTAFGFCDADASPAPQCSTAATDPCMGVTQCGTETSRACSDADTITTCAPNAFGCFVATDTECAPEVCDASGEMPVCVDPCSLVDTCAAATQCDGDALVTCAPDANGCLVETSRTTCEDACGLSAGSPACIDPLCPTVEPLVLDCESGTVTGNTAGGSTVFTNTSNVCATLSYAGPERAYRFRNPSGPVDVQIVSTRAASSGDFDLFVIRGNGADVCTSDSLTCAGRSTTTNATETVNFFSRPTDTHYVVYDVYTTSAPTTEFTLAITCTPIVCGDGAVGNGEQCDDGNTDADDGCSPTCQREPGFDCTTSAPTSCTRIVCGDSIVGSTEQCDDGNTDDLDGCSSSCEREDGWVCAGAPSVCQELAPNHLCADGAATPVSPTAPFTAPQTITHTGEDLTLGGPRPTGTGCNGTGDNRALFYEVTIPAMSWVDIVSTRDSTSDLVITAQETCSPTGCLTNSDTPERLRLDNLTGTPVTRIVSIHNWTTSGAGTYDVAFTFTRFAPNAACASATPVDADTGVITGENLAAGAARPSGTGCGTGENAALYYAVEVGPYQTVDIVVTPDSSSATLAITTQTACGAACGQREATPGTTRARLANPTASTVTQFVSVYPTAAASIGTFQIEFTYQTVAPNAACEGGTTIEGTRVLSGERLTYGGPPPSGTECGVTAGRSALYYDVEIPPGMKVDVAVTPDPSTNPSLVVLTRDSCSATACTSRNDTAAPTAQLRNASTETVTRSVAVHSRTAAADSGIYDISFVYSALASNAWCGAATELEPGDEATGENLALGGPRPTGTGCGSGGNHALYYAVEIAPYSEVTVTATPASGGISLVALDACPATACSGLDSTAPREVRLPNATASPITQYVAVYNTSATTTPTFDLTTSQRLFRCGDGQIEGLEQCDDGNENNDDGCSSTCTLEPGFVCYGSPYMCRPAAPNASCGGATVVTGTDAATGESATLGGPRPQGTGCGSSTSDANNRALYYRLEIPPQTRVQVDARGSADLVLITENECGAAACTLRRDVTGNNESTTLRNDTLDPISRIVVIHPFSNTLATWDVDFTYEPYVCGDGAIEGVEVCDDGNNADGDGCSASCTPESGFACVGNPSVCVGSAPPNAYCAGATVVTSDDVFTDESTGVGGPILGTSCGSGGNRAIYYAVTAQPGQMVAVQTANISGDIQLFVADSCSATSCLSSTNTSPERYSFRNTTDAPLTRIIGVRSNSTTAPASYDISFAYFNATFTSITAACVDTSGGTVVSLTGDDNVTSSAALPITFSLLGSPVTHWTANTNGLLQLTSGSASGSTAFSNTAIPNTSTPNGFVAAFWDDLEVTSSGSVRTLVTGDPGSRRFVVEWRNVLVRSVTSSAVTFQAHLLEGSNAVELHYCTASGTQANVLGGSATAGLEDVTGTLGVQFTHNTAGGMTPGSGYRYAP